MPIGKICAHHKKLLLELYLCIFECFNLLECLASIIQISYMLETSYSKIFNFVVLHVFYYHNEPYKMTFNSNFGADHFWH